MAKQQKSKNQDTILEKAISSLASLLKKSQKILKKYNYFEFLADSIIDYVSKELGKQPSERYLKQLRKDTAVAIVVSFSKAEIIIDLNLFRLYMQAFNVSDEETVKLEIAIRKAFNKVLRPIFNLQSKVLSLSIKFTDTIQQKFNRLPTIKSYYKKAKSVYKQLQQYFGQNCDEIPYIRVKNLIKELIRIYIILAGVYNGITSYARTKGHVPVDYTPILIGVSAAGAANELKTFIQRVDNKLEQFFKEIERNLQKKTAAEFIDKLLDLHDFAYEFDYYDSKVLNLNVSWYIQSLVKDIKSAYKNSREKCIYSVTLTTYRRIKSMYNDILKITTKSYDTIKKLENELYNTKNELAKQKRDAKKYKIKYEEISKEAAELRSELINKEGELDDMNIAYKELKREYDKLVNKYNELAERNNELISKVRSLQKDLEWAQERFKLGLKTLAASGAIVFVDIIVYIILAIIVARRLRKSIFATILNPVLVFKEAITHISNVLEKQNSFRQVPISERIYAAVEIFLLLILFIGGIVGIVVAIRAVSILINSYRTAEELEKEIKSLKTEGYLL